MPDGAAAPAWYREVVGALTPPYTGPRPGAPHAGQLAASTPPTRAAGGDAEDVAGYIRTAAAQRGIDPDTAIKVAQSEGGLVPNRTGAFATGKSFWPFQLHYGGAGTPYAQYGTVAGMGNTFTERTGWQPGDPAAWRAATDYALDAAKQQGWGAWYGARNQGITGFQGITRAAPWADTPQTPPEAPSPGSPAGAGSDPAWYRELLGGTGGQRAARGASGAPTTPDAAPSATPVPATGAVGKQALAASWALSNLGSRDFYNLCQRFIEQAYGTGGQYGSAAAAGKALFKTADPAQADVGDLVFFRPDASNGYAGHAAIYLGNGEMVGATNAGVTKDNLLTNPYWRNLLVGFGDPPQGWQGRASTENLVKGAGQLVGSARAAVSGAAPEGGTTGGGPAPAWYQELVGR
jgi:cell wall-associated NlpC family hydrolase